MLHRHPLLSLVTGAYLVFLGWLTLTPQASHRYEADLMVRILDALHRRGYAESIDYARFEFLANIALFVPVGVFLLVLFGSGGWWLAIAAAVAMTVGIESLQTQIPGRVPDDRDIVANGFGAVVGVAVGLVLTLPATLRRHRQRPARAAQLR